MNPRDRALLAALTLALLLAIAGGWDEHGWSATAAATVLTPLLLGIALVMHCWTQRSSPGSARSAEGMPMRRLHRISSVDRIGDGPLTDIDPRLFLRPENSLGDDAIALILKNYGAQIWGVSMYWHHRKRTHFIDHTYPTLLSGEEIIAFVQRAALPAEFDLIVAYTRRDGREQEERWSLVVQQGAFDCVYGGKVTGGVLPTA